MIAKKECVAMLLAGGQGSRLYVLTTNIAKPAIPFGGKYKLIDFPLSNCINSGIDTVGVLTQYQPHELNAYIGSGQPWDLDRLEGGVHVLPPYMRGKGGEWYKGTANAIYQNMSFVDHYDPEYVLVLGGDHIYKMDYSKMLDRHKKTKADCTIAVFQVPMEEASRFGVLNTNPDGSVYEFEEKPKKPKSDLISMGIYIFNWKKLRRYLTEDEADPKSKNDFGASIVPSMLKNNEKLMVYRFDGYWKDVGTIRSLWEANMDMLKSDDCDINLHDHKWKIYARNPTAPPHFVGEEASVVHSLITEGCQIFGDVDNSVLFHSVNVGEGARVSHSIIMPGVVIGRDAVIEYAVIAENAFVQPGARVGAKTPDVKIAVVAEGVVIGTGRVVLAGDMIAEDLTEVDAQ